jgi:hypothetical protein
MESLARAFKSKTPFCWHAISVKTENQAVSVGERSTVEVRKFIRRTAAGNFAAAIGTDRS